MGALLMAGERLGWTRAFGLQLVLPGVQRFVYPSSDNTLRAALKSGHHVSCPTVDVPENTVDVIEVLSEYELISSARSGRAVPLAEDLPVTVHVPGTGQFVALMTPQKLLVRLKVGFVAALIKPAGWHVVDAAEMVLSSPA